MRKVLRIVSRVSFAGGAREWYKPSHPEFCVGTGHPSNGWLPDRFEPGKARVLPRQ